MIHVKMCNVVIAGLRGVFVRLREELLVAKRKELLDGKTFS